MKYRYVRMVALSFCLLFCASGVWSDPAQDAESVISKATVEMYQAIKKQCEEIEASPLQLHRLVEEILIPHADFRRMAQLALGKHWRSGDPAQRAEFVTEFRHLLIRTYSTAVQMASLEAIQYLPSRAGSGGDNVMVRTEVRRPGEPMVAINYRLYRAESQWLVYDMLVDGVSLVSSYRTTFAEEIKARGFPGLIAILQKKNQRPLVDANADLVRKRAGRACK